MICNKTTVCDERRKNIKSSYNKKMCVCVTSKCDKHVCVYACVREYKKQERENYEKECALVGDILVKCNYI